MSKVSTKEAAEVLNLPHRTIKYQIKKAFDSGDCEVKGEGYRFMFFWDKGRQAWEIQFPKPKKYKKEAVADFARAPEYNREKALERRDLLLKLEGVKGKKAIEKKIRELELNVSYYSIYRWRRRYKKFGVSGLLPNYGKSQKRKTGFETFAGYFSKIKPDWYEHFKRLYLQEGGPGMKVAWTSTVGYIQQSEDIHIENIPTPRTFHNTVVKEIGHSRLKRLREGYQKFNREDNYYLTRDDRNIKPGEMWVSDHHQLDITAAEVYKEAILRCSGESEYRKLLKQAKTTFPWVSVWRDYKTGKWLGWVVSPYAPNSDRVFESFMIAVKEYGVPKHILIDNGKDYRCRDFAGGRPNNIKVQVEEKDARMSMVEELGIKVHFSLPYNAQAKPVERDFREVKDMFGRLNVGFRGGNVVERPEVLLKETKAGKIMPFEELQSRFYKFISKGLNKVESYGKNLLGRSRDQAFAEEFEGLEMVDSSALKFFVARTSEVKTIQRNGVKHPRTNLPYWGEWMAGQKGEKVYLRLNPENWAQAWAFDRKDIFLGTCEYQPAVSALAASKEERKALKKQIEKRRHNEKVARAPQPERLSHQENEDAFLSGVEKIAKDKGLDDNGGVRVPSGLRNTKFDEMERKLQEAESAGDFDTSFAAGLKRPENDDDDLFLFKSDIDE